MKKEGQFLVLFVINLVVSISIFGLLLQSLGVGTTSVNLFLVQSGKAQLLATRQNALFLSGFPNKTAALYVNGLEGASHTSEHSYVLNDINSVRMKLTNELNTSRKFLLFQTSGGFNNQRIILLRALRICKILNRTCFIPMAGSHSSFYKNYNKLDLDNLFSMDRIFDFSSFDSYAKSFPINMRFQDFEKLLKKIYSEREWYIIKQSQEERSLNPIYESNLTLLDKRNEKVMYFAGPTMWQHFSTTPRSFEKEVETIVRYTPFFRALSADIIESLFPSKDYFAIHLRLGDNSKKFYGPKRKAKQLSHYYRKRLFVQRKKRKNAERNDLYIATMPTSNISEIEQLKEDFNFTRSQNIDRDILYYYDSLFNLPKQRKLRNDILAIFEQIICIHASAFVGTDSSTFTHYIIRARKLPKEKKEFLFGFRESTEKFNNTLN